MYTSARCALMSPCVYPAIVKLWSDAWAEFVPFLQFDKEIRRIVCTTNAIESVNARIRKAVKARGHFPNERASRPQVRLPGDHGPRPDRQGRARWTQRWKGALNAVAESFFASYKKELIPALAGPQICEVGQLAGRSSPRRSPDPTPGPEPSRGPDR